MGDSVISMSYAEVRENSAQTSNGVSNRDGNVETVNEGDIKEILITTRAQSEFCERDGWNTGSSMSIAFKTSIAPPC